MHSWFCKVQGTISDVPLPKNHMQILCVGTEDHDQETYHLTKHLISPMKHHLQVLTKFTDTFFKQFYDKSQYLAISVAQIKQLQRNV